MKISIITATYNSEQHLKETLGSVAAQTYSNIEHLIIDGASTDRTVEIAEQWGAPFVKIVSEPDRGIYDAFNKGVRMATGDVIMFLNSDDYLYSPDVIGKVCAQFMQEPSVNMVYANILEIDESNGFSQLYGKEVTLEDFSFGYMIPHPGMFVRKELFDTYGPFNEQYRIAADYDWVIRVFKDEPERARYLDETISVFRLGGASTTPKYKDKVESERKSIILDHFGEDRRQVPSTNDVNIYYYRKWAELLLSGYTITQKLSKSGIHHVSIFGSMYAGVLLKKDLECSGIEVVSFLDNSLKRIGLYIGEVPIHPPEWLRENRSRVDAVILTFEGEYEEQIKEQVAGILGSTDALQVYSWRKLIDSLG